MSLLEQPEAQALLADAVLTPEAVRGCEDRLARFLERYLPRFRRAEQRHNAALVIRGLLGGLKRKTCEPIAVEAGVHRKPIQFLVGAGKWDDEAVMAEIRRHVAEELGDERAVLILDASTFPKSGSGSCGVGRQWCGRLGKQENCQRGIFLAYAAGGGYAPLDRKLYLPRDWADDPARREVGHVPEEIEFREGWRIAAELIERTGPGAAPQLGGRRRRIRPARPIPGLAAPPGRTLRARRARRHSRSRPGMRPARASDRPGSPSAGAVQPGRCLGGPAVGWPLDPTDRPGWREGPAAGRRDGGAREDQTGASSRAGGAVGGDPHRRGEAPGALRPE